jgi:Protein of unknown function (DUF4235)
VRPGNRLAMKLLYKPFGTLAGIVSGLVAGALFKLIWRAIAHEDDAPSAKDQHRSWTEVVSAAAVEGAVFGSVKAAVDRAGAVAYSRVTGVWPGNTDTPAKR